jgi:hypothetical protein
VSDDLPTARSMARQVMPGGRRDELPWAWPGREACHLGLNAEAVSWRQC